MLNDKRTPSRMRTFRFNDAMEKDLNFLSDLWGCTATDAIARALTNAVTLERMYIIQTNVKNEQESKQAFWKAEMEHRIYSQPLTSLQSLDGHSAGEPSTATDEVAQTDPIQIQTTAQIEKPAPSAPITKESTASVPASVAGESAASVSTTTKGGNKVRWQFKIFLKDDYGTPSGETAEIAIANAKKWLHERGRDDFEPYFPAGTHCKTIRI